MTFRLERCFPIALVLVLIGCSGDGERGGGGQGTDGEGAGRPEAAAAEDPRFARAQQPFFGDLDEIRQRRFLRVLVSYSKTSFFYDGPDARGFEVEMFKEYEDFLNKGTRDPYARVRVLFIPTPFDRLLAQLAAGRGEVAAAGLTLTAARQEEAAFSAPYLTNVRELVVTGPASAELVSVEDLAGRRVVVRAGSSYAAHLRALGDRLAAAGSEAIRVEEADPRLVTEDLLEMVNVGALDFTVADSHIAEAWAEVLPGDGRAGQPPGGASVGCLRHRRLDERLLPGHEGVPGASVPAGSQVPLLTALE